MDTETKALANTPPLVHCHGIGFAFVQNFLGRAGWPGIAFNLVVTCIVGTAPPMRVPATSALGVLSRLDLARTLHGGQSSLVQKHEIVV